LPFSAPDLTPLESFLFTNRNRAESTSRVKSGEVMRKKRAASKAKESVQKKVGLEGIGDRAPRCRWDRCGWQRALGGDQPGPRSGAGTAVRMFYRGSTGDGALAGGERSAQRGHAIDGGVLDSGIRSARTAWSGSVSGECAAYQECAGAQD